MYPIIILAGGKGTRLLQVTKTVPKSLMKINNRPFIYHQLDLLRLNGFREFIFALGYKADNIEKACRLYNCFDGNLHFRYCRDNKHDNDQFLLGTGGCINNIVKFYNMIDPFFVINGDSYLEYDYQEIQRYYEKPWNLGQLVVWKNNNKYGKSNIEIQSGRIIRYDKHRVYKIANLKYIDCGVCIFHPNAFSHIPKNYFCDMGQIYNHLIVTKRMGYYEVDKRFWEIGTPKSLKEFESYITEQKCIKSSRQSNE